MDRLEIISDGISIKEQDIESIIHLVGETDTTWNNRDANAFAALFEERADFQFHTGFQIQGKGAIERFWGEKVFPGMSERLRHIGSLKRIRFISDNVAICDGGLRIIELSTEPEQQQVHLDTHGTIVAVKQSARWYISAVRLISFAAE
jgi:uncharacterized protein (TIGR02246 family)